VQSHRSTGINPAVAIGALLGKDQLPVSRQTQAVHLVAMYDLDVALALEQFFQPNCARSCIWNGCFGLRSLIFTICHEGETCQRHAAGNILDGAVHDSDLRFNITDFDPSLVEDAVLRRF
jgi:hypothetical protein